MSDAAEMPLSPVGRLAPIPLLFGLFEQREDALRVIPLRLCAGRIGLAPLGRIAPRAVEQPIAQARSPRLRAHQRFGDETSQSGDDVDRGEACGLRNESRI